MFFNKQIVLIFQPPNQFQNRYSEPDDRDWRGRSGQLPPAEEKSWDNIRDNREFGNRYDSRQQDASQINRQDQQGFAKVPILRQGWQALTDFLVDFSPNHVIFYFIL